MIGSHAIPSSPIASKRPPVGNTKFEIRKSNDKAPSEVMLSVQTLPSFTSVHIPSFKESDMSIAFPYLYGFSFTMLDASSFNKKSTSGLGTSYVFSRPMFLM